MAEETFNDGNWKTVEIVFWSYPESAAGGDGPIQKCTKDPAQIAMTAMRIYHWAPAGLHVNRGMWALMRNLLRADEVVDKDFGIEMTMDSQRTQEINRVSEKQCKWAPGLRPMEWQEN
eukprot:2504400-Pyramimonas_sp.AAC.1